MAGRISLKDLILNPHSRYQIDNNDEAWKDTEDKVKDALLQGKAPVVSVKSSKKKRKAEQTAAEVYKEAFGDDGEEKKKKKSKKAKK